MDLLILAFQFHLHGFNHVHVLLADLQYIHDGTNGQRQAHSPRVHGGKSVTGISRAPKKSNATGLALGRLPQEDLAS